MGTLNKPNSAQILAIVIGSLNKIGETEIRWTFKIHDPNHA